MQSSKTKVLVIVFALLLCTGLVTVGCKKKAADNTSWVNTGSMPGNTFSNHSSSKETKKHRGIVYLGSSTTSPNFGPSFEFKDLK